MGPVVGFIGAVFFGAAAGASAAYVLAVNLARIALLSLVSKLTAPKIDLTQAAVDKMLTVRSSVQPQAFVYGQDMISGPLIFANTSGDDNQNLHRLVALTGREVEDILAFRIDDDDIVIPTDIPDRDDVVTVGRFADVLEINTQLGTSTQTAIAQLTAAFPTVWTSAHRARGWSTLYTKMTIVGGNTAYERGIPQNLRALVKGHKVYDPRLDTTNGGTGAHRLADETTWEWSNNAALCLADWLRWDEVGMGEVDERIDWPLVAAAADICDESVTVPNGTQNRYTTNLTFYSDQSREQIKEMLETAMLGRCIFSQGKWRMWAGAAQAATVTLSEVNLRGSVQIQASAPSTERYNRVRGKFIDPDRDYTANAYPEQASTQFETDDNGLKPRTFDFNACNNSYEAQRNAIIKLRQSRNQRTVVFEGNWSCFRVQSGTTVSVTLAEANWTAKKFFVTGWELDKDGAGVNIIMVEEFDSDWDDPLVGDYSTRTPTGDLVFVDQGNLEVKLSDANIHNVRTNASTTAGFKLGADGQLYYSTAAGGWTTAGVPNNEWLFTGTSDYWAQLTLNSGTLDTGTVTIWQPLTADVSATIVQATTGVNTANVTVKIADDDAGANVITTGVMDLSATNASSGFRLRGVGTRYYSVVDGIGSQNIAQPSYNVGDLLMVCMQSSFFTGTDPTNGGWNSAATSDTLKLFWRIATGDANDVFTMDAKSITAISTAQMAAFDRDTFTGTFSTAGAGTLEVNNTTFGTAFPTSSSGEFPDFQTLCISMWWKTTNVNIAASGVTDNLPANVVTPTNIGTIDAFSVNGEGTNPAGARSSWGGWTYWTQDVNPAPAVASADQTEVPESSGFESVTYYSRFFIYRSP
jgi:hypothetical protein